MHTEKAIQKELDRMDGGLFLDKDADEYGRVYYSVKHMVQDPSGGFLSPYTALKWVDPDGNPKPLSEDLISALRAQEGSIKEALTQAIVNNAALKELQRQKALEQSQEAAKEWDATKRGTKFVSTGPGGMDHKTALNKRDI